MRSVMQAIWLLTVAFGNLIFIVIAKAKAFDKQVSNNPLETKPVV